MWTDRTAFSRREIRGHGTGLQFPPRSYAHAVLQDKINSFCAAPVNSKSAGRIDSRLQLLGQLPEMHDCADSCGVYTGLCVDDVLVLDSLGGLSGTLAAGAGAGAPGSCGVS